MLNKNELGRLIGPLVGGKAAGREVVDLIFDTIMERVAAGERVLISNLGVWERRVLAPRAGRDPVTGQQVIHPEKARPHFSPATQWRQRVAAGEIASAKPLPRGRAANLARDRQRAEEAAARRAAARRS